MKKTKLSKNSTKIGENLWIAGGYYLDFDSFGQFRIIGPNNHLFCGLVDIAQEKITIKSVKEKNHILKVQGHFNSECLNLYCIAMDDIRTMRGLIGLNNNFLSVRKKDFSRLAPHIVKKIRIQDETGIRFKRVYEDKFYETVFSFKPDIKIEKIKKPYLGFKLSRKSSKKIPFTIYCATNDLHFKKIKKLTLFKEANLNLSLFNSQADFIKNILVRTEIEIKHLLEWGKTSGDRFGTIFPRDWIESADLGFHDLTPEAREYMYQASFKNINEKGEGWHEDIVGEYKYEFEISGKKIIDRKMIDIEPHYFLSLDYLSKNFWPKDKTAKDKLRKVAKYIIKQARKNDFITFKKVPSRKKNQEEYYCVGNWRDTGEAFKRIGKVIAPFDVNAIFYPRALENIKKYQKALALSKKSLKDIDILIEKWNNKKKDFLFKNSDGKIAYALALYDIEKIGKRLSYKKLEVNHLDESYLYTYSQASIQEIKSFCQRLLDPEYFYTKSGPLLIAKKNKYSYTPQAYHGLVIWIKQTAFAVFGLSKHLKIAIKEEWPLEVQKLIKKTIVRITEDTLHAIGELNAVPEVYIDNKGTPKLFSEQVELKNKDSQVQLWSAVGIRRIIRKYCELLTDKKYKNL